MTDSQPTDEPTRPADSAPPPGDGTASGDGAADGSPSGGGASATASNIMESLRDVIDDIAERAGPTVKEYSAKAAELTASAADKAAPLARKAGEATADASSKLAERSRAWASEVRTALGGDAPTPDAPVTDRSDPEQPAP